MNTVYVNCLHISKNNTIKTEGRHSVYKMIVILIHLSIHPHALQLYQLNNLNSIYQYKRSSNCVFHSFIKNN